MIRQILILISITLIHILLHSSGAASTVTSNKTYVDPTTGMELVFVPGGCFQMGDMFGEGKTDEKPVHEVCLDDFYIGKYEVTQGEYLQITGTNPSRFNKGDRYPVDRVNWFDTQAFIERLNSKSSQSYRLPTEAEWEYAARGGGKKVRFGTGRNTIGSNEANYNALPDYKTSYSRNGIYRESPVAVGSFSPNSLGIYDMSGNLWEWCQDWYDEEYYKSSPRNNPTGPSSANLSMLKNASWAYSRSREQVDNWGFRVLRGGSWAYYPWSVRAANRNYMMLNYRGYNRGFRLVLPVQR